MEATRESILAALGNPLACASSVAPDALRAHLTAHGWTCVASLHGGTVERWRHPSGDETPVLCDRATYVDYGDRVLDALQRARGERGPRGVSSFRWLLDLADLYAASTTEGVDER